ncbi:hypothetical protein HMPREF9006_1467 [Actinomyces sp. oral taxon 180 str. F0310]|nr:hypothetical protein HMPREF9006_1467 [Actinomyces sp. oral taxon 180 str. F0310]
MPGGPPPLTRGTRPWLAAPCNIEDSSGRARHAIVSRSRIRRSSSNAHRTANTSTWNTSWHNPCG